MFYCKRYDDKNIKIECFTDNHQLYDSVYSIGPVYSIRSVYSILYTLQDKCLRTEITLLREMITKKEIARISWTENNSHIADCLMKYEAPLEKLLNTLKTESIDFYN